MNRISGIAIGGENLIDHVDKTGARLRPTGDAGEAAA